jgi:hypothetical protein
LGAITYNYLGRSVYPDPYLNADIGDYIIFNAPLNDTQRILVENYLSSKYNIALSLYFAPFQLNRETKNKPTPVSAEQ